MRNRAIPVRALAVALSVLFAAPGSGAARDDLDPGIARDDLPDRGAEAGPLALFARVEAAWADEDAEELVALLDSKEKVRLAFERGGPRGGWFNRDQAFYLLKDMFEYLRTDRFRFEKFWNLEEAGRSPYAVAVREFRESDGVPRTDQVFISLRRRGGAWTVGEIRTVER